MNAKLAGFLYFKVLRWRIVPGKDVLPKDKKAIFLYAPHTSIWDTVIGYLYFQYVGGRVSIMIKKEAFKGPFGWFLRKLGGFPIDRSRSQGAMLELIHAFNDSDSFYLCICPEGTRKAVKRWKTGYHTIAMQTGVPVYLSYADFKKKEASYGEPFELTGNAREDTDRIQAEYKKMQLTALHPKGYTTE